MPPDSEVYAAQLEQLHAEVPAGWRWAAALTATLVLVLGVKWAVTTSASVQVAALRTLGTLVLAALAGTAVQSLPAFCHGLRRD